MQLGPTFVEGGALRTFFTADTHFSHARIIELCSRPFTSVNEMNEELLARINNTVSSSDRLVILGDVCMGKLDESLSILSRIEAAELVLVPGNHDRWSPAYHHRGTPDEVLAKQEEWRRKYAATRPRTIAMPSTMTRDGDVVTPVTSWQFCQFTEALEGSALSDVAFSHFPYEGDSHDEDRYDFLRPSAGQPVVHGHVHNSWKVRGNQFNVGVDVNDFTPVPEETLNEWVSSL